MTHRDRASWRTILRAWLKTKARGHLFHSRDVFRWAGSGAIPLLPGDTQPICSNGRLRWRHTLSGALTDLYRAGELQHPGIAKQVWRVP
jgi:hypothetical protein